MVGEPFRVICVDIAGLTIRYGNEGSGADSVENDYRRRGYRRTI